MNKYLVMVLRDVLGFVYVFTWESVSYRPAWHWDHFAVEEDLEHHPHFPAKPAQVEIFLEKYLNMHHDYVFGFYIWVVYFIKYF